MGNSSVLDENGKVRIELETQGDIAVIRPTGILDEDVNFTIVMDTVNKMLPILRGIHFDLGGVKRMNSCGVREWILLMERIAPTLPLSFVNVNELFVEQANMIPGMFGKRKAKLLSFHVPYHCNTCNTDVSMVVQTKDIQILNGEPKAPSFNCAKCSKPLEFDWIEDDYFNFLRFL